MQVVVWIQKTESSSAKEQDGEFECKKVNDEVIPIHPRDSFLYSLPRRFRKHHVWCLVPSPPHAARAANNKGGPGPLV
jgi:hypothetical protein